MTFVVFFCVVSLRAMEIASKGEADLCLTCSERATSLEFKSVICVVFAGSMVDVSSMVSFGFVIETLLDSSMLSSLLSTCWD